MPIEFKDKSQMIDNIIQNIKDKLSFDIDISDGEPLRDIIEAIVQELEFQYWQIEQIYNGSFIDTAENDNLSSLVKLLGIERKPPAKATGTVKFYRETPADMDYLIPVGTLVETLPNRNGISIRFETIENAVLAAGATEVEIGIVALETGKSGNITSNKITIINNPPLGVESVTNTSNTIGGEEEESDNELKERASKALETAGLGTIDALKYKLLSTNGVNSVIIIDMARGIGTVDILILGDTLPMPSNKLDELKKIIADSKAAGIDVEISEPTPKPVNISLNLTLDTNTQIPDVIDNVNKAIDDYFKQLAIGDTLYRNQLSKAVLNSSNRIIDIQINSPSSNVTANNKEIIICSTINIS